MQIKKDFINEQEIQNRTMLYYDSL